MKGQFVSILIRRNINELASMQSVLENLSDADIHMYVWIR